MTHQPASTTPLRLIPAAQAASAPKARLLAAIAAVLLATLTPAASHGATEPPKPPSPNPPPTPAHSITPWIGGPVPGGTRATAYCAAESIYSNNVTLSLARTRAGDVTIAMFIPGLAATLGNRWPVTVTTLSDNPTPHTAEVIEVSAAGTLVAIPLGSGPAVGIRLTAAHTLTITSQTDRADFLIPAVPQALSDLTKCAASLP